MRDVAKIIINRTSQKLVELFLLKFNSQGDAVFVLDLTTFNLISMLT